MDERLTEEDLDLLRWGTICKEQRAEIAALRADNALLRAVAEAAREHVKQDHPTSALFTRGALVRELDALDALKEQR